MHSFNGKGICVRCSSSYAAVEHFGKDCIQKSDVEHAQYPSAPPSNHWGKQEMDFNSRIIAALDNFRCKVETLVSTFFHGLLKFLVDAREWITEVITRVGRYLVKFFEASIKLFWAAFKLSLFYLPSIVLLVAYKFNASNIWIVISLVWAVSITLIGLTYKQK